MSDFKGFTDSETFTRVPDSFFKLLKETRDADELKVTLYAIWWIDHMEGPFRALSETDFDAKKLGLSEEEIRRALEKAVKRGSILRSQHEADVVYFLNSPRGRAAAEAFAKGQLRESDRTMSTLLDRPNIFKLYEENIGPLTPLIADMLKEAEELYREEWFEEAFTIAVKNNKRNWRYVEAILKRWKEEGKNGKKDQQDSIKSSERYTDSQFSEFLKRD
jgi:DNA replication protein